MVGRLWIRVLVHVDRSTDDIGNNTTNCLSKGKNEHDAYIL